MSTESFTNTVVIKEDGIKCFLEILEKGKDYKRERSNEIPLVSADVLKGLKLKVFE